MAHAIAFWIAAAPEDYSMFRLALIFVAAIVMTIQAVAHGHGSQHGPQMQHSHPRPPVHKHNKGKSQHKSRSLKSGGDATPGKQDTRKGEPLPDGGRIDDPIAGAAGDRPDADDEQP